MKTVYQYRKSILKDNDHLANRNARFMQDVQFFVFVVHCNDFTFVFSFNIIILVDFSQLYARMLCYRLVFG